MNACVHDLFAAQAWRCQTSPAICAWDGRLTYGELNKAANRLARYLIRTHRVQVEEIIHVCFEKSVWHFVAILAINKAGAAWSPLDPSHPVQRSRSIVGQTGARLILASPSNAKLCRDIVDTVEEVTAELDSRLARRGTDDGNFSSGVGPHNAVYVLFTSGSTGTPKGFVMDHDAVCTGQVSIARRLGISSKVRMLQFCSFVFDASVGEIVASLISGATLCVPSDETRMNALAQFVKDESVNWAVLTPAFARTLRPADFPTLELLLLTGEMVGRDVLEAWFGHVRLWNGWGPAETCVWSSLHEWQSKDDSPLTVGRPVACRCWIVEPDNPQVVAPIGCAGEVVIQGPTLLRTYIGGGELNRRVFLDPVPPWAQHQHLPGWGRLYLTGDLASYRTDGTIEFISRKDTQIKIRGLRVELEEIEYRIREALPKAQQVIVDAFKSEFGAQTLVAYFCYDKTTTQGTRLKSSDEVFMPVSSELTDHMDHLVRYLETVLTQYMIPTVFIPCSTMPATTSSKIDRKVLRNLTGQLSKQDLASYALVQTSKRPPETKMEFRLQSMWASLLGVLPDSIGRDDSFLGIGGDSITAIQLVARAREVGIQITVGEIFKNPRLYAVAASAVDVSSEQEQVQQELKHFDLTDDSTRQAIQAEVERHISEGENVMLDNAFPVTPLQEGLLASSIKQPRSYIAKWVYRLASGVDVNRFIKAWDETVMLCTNLRTRVVQTCSTTLQVHLRNDTSWEPTEGLQLPDFLKQANTIKMTFGSRLSRWALIKSQLGHHYFVLVAHHASNDGWTMRIVFDTLYSVYIGRPVANLRPFDAFINHVFQTSDELSMRKYWHDQLKDAKSAIFPPKPTEEQRARCPPEDRTMAHSFIPSTRPQGSIITLGTILRASWALLLARYCETDDICIGTSVSGRQAAVPGITEMPGPTVATVPVRIPLKPEQKVADFLLQVQIQATEMIPHEQYGIQNIAKLGPAHKDACDFSSLLVVQPFQKMFNTESSQPDNAILIAENVGKDENQRLFDGYFTYPLVLLASISDAEVTLNATYDASVLRESQIVALVHQLEHVIQTLACAEGDLPLGAVSAASSWDLQVSKQRNGKMLHIVESTFHEMFAKQAATRPNTVAIRSREGEFTYETLNHMTDKLAAYLVGSSKVCRGDLVLVCFEKSLWHFVSILAISKAGAAWVPLDPSHPIERLRQVASETRAKIALVSPRNSDLCRSLANVTLEVTPDFISKLEPGSVKVRSSPRDAVYVLFTSGSTGTPKGLVMEHGAACTAMMDIAGRTGLGPGVNILQFSAFVFDVSIGEIIGPLISGATISIPSDQDRTDNIAGFINDFDVTWAYLTPSYTRTLKPSEVPSLELLLLAGEATSRDLLETWFGHLRLLNGWGPAETCCFSAIHEWTSLNESPLTIGQPVGGLCWIVEPKDCGKLAPVGTIGEVIIQGPTILREYLNDTDKTAQAVISPPPEWAPSRTLPHWGRLFRSGDLCSYNADGTIKYSRRKDTQVKIRGMRVELGEVEHHFRTHLANDSGHIVADLLSRGVNSVQLVLYFTLGDNYHNTASKSGGEVENGSEDLFLQLEQDLRVKLRAVVRELRSSLPRYMIPSFFIPCRRMPLIGPSRKLDRSVLRRAAQGLDQIEFDRFSLLETSRRAPETQTEKKLQEIWAELLEISKDAIGVDDGFYHVGGDSIGIMKLAKRIEREFQTEFNSRDLSDSHSSISAIASLIDGSARPSLSIDFADEIALITKSLEHPLSKLLNKPCVPRSNRLTVLLTGASGFLGTEILRQLLDSPTVGSVIAHVRARSQNHGLHRITEAAKRSGWWSSRYLKKLELWIGDLQQPRIGLTDDQWSRVCGTAREGNIDSIVHNGASVNWNLNYTSLRPANINSTMELLAATMASPVDAKFVFVSGGVSLVGVEDPESVFEILAKASGYIQSKFVADIVFKNLFAQLPTSQNRVSLVRPGKILGCKNNKGVANTDDYLWRVVAGAVGMGRYPTSDYDQWMLAADVSTLSENILGKLFADSHGDHAFDDMVIGVPTAKFWELVNAHLDKPLTPMPWSEWTEEVTRRLLAAAAGDNQTGAHPLLSVLDFLSSLGSIQPTESTNKEGDEMTERLCDAVTANVRYLNSIGYLQQMVLEEYKPVDVGVVKRSAAF